MTNRTAPQRPTGLSGQEEEDLRALEKGYDADAGALPDPDPHDDPTRKPGDDAAPVRRAASTAPGSPGSNETPPMDRPDNNTNPGPANLDPDPDRRMP